MFMLFLLRPLTKPGYRDVTMHALYFLSRGRGADTKQIEKKTYCMANRVQANRNKFEYLKFGLLLVRHSNAFIIQKLDFLEMFISVCRCLNANMSIFALRPYVFWKYVFMHMEYVVLFLNVFLYFIETYDSV